MEQIRVAQIVNTHGVRGEVRVRPLTDFPDVRFAPGKELVLKQPPTMEGAVRTVLVERSRPHKKWWLLKFADLDSLNEVEPLKGAELWAPAEEELPLAEGEYLFRDIIGCRVWTTDGRLIGAVREILRPGANDVWVVRSGRKEFLIPYIDEVVRQIDVTDRRIVIDPLPGLLEDGE
jgi:16S rRNA processing protein RimM